MPEIRKSRNISDALSIFHFSRKISLLLVIFPKLRDTMKIYQETYIQYAFLNELKLLYSIIYDLNRLKSDCHIDEELWKNVCVIQ